MTRSKGKESLILSIEICIPIFVEIYSVAIFFIQFCIVGIYNKTGNEIRIASIQIRKTIIYLNILFIKI